MKITGVIPARYDSSRFPGKPLVDIMGKSMIQRVYEQAIQVESLDKVIIATDDTRIFDHATEKKMNVIMTAKDHPSGTDRCAEVAQKIDCDVVVNIQGDEPFLEPNDIELLVSRFKNPDCQIATLITPVSSAEDMQNPNRVKCVTNLSGKALYFSRSPIPYEQGKTAEKGFRHIGLYAYRRSVLLEISKLKPSALEQSESLEQLRWLENGYSIYTAVTHAQSPNIDTPEDLEAVLSTLR